MKINENKIRAEIYQDRNIHSRSVLSIKGLEKK